jgi:phosphoglycolate phosphatase
MNSSFPERLQAVIFDLDGTLLDTASEFVQVVQQLRDEHGREPMDEDLIRSHVSNGARALVSLALDLAEEDPGFEQQRLRLLEIYRGLLGSSAAPYPGIEDLLLDLEAAGVAWGISTNKPRALTEVLLQRVPLQPAPASVVCADQVTHPKPHPEPLLLNCVEMRCEARNAVYIGDHQRDIDAGRGAGMYTIAAGYGYIVAGDDPATWGAHSLAASGRELAELIARAFH